MGEAMNDTMHETYRKIYRDLVDRPVPHEGFVLPNDILKGHPVEDTEPATQHERLLRAFYQLLLESFVASRADVIALARGRERSADNAAHLP